MVRVLIYSTVTRKVGSVNDKSFEVGHRASLYYCHFGSDCLFSFRPCWTESPSSKRRGTESPSSKRRGTESPSSNRRGTGSPRSKPRGTESSSILTGVQVLVLTNSPHKL